MPKLLNEFCVVKVETLFDVGFEGDSLLKTRGIVVGVDLLSLLVSVFAVEVGRILLLI